MIMYRVQVLLSDRRWRDKSALYETVEEAQRAEQLYLDQGWYTRIVDDAISVPRKSGADFDKAKSMPTIDL